jgi:hypothetical protein
MHIDDWGWSARARRILRENDVKYTGEIATFGRDYWKRTPGCGIVTIWEFEAAIGGEWPARPIRAFRELQPLALD